MKALAIDCAITRLSIAAKNDEHTVSAIYDIGMKQSETLLPAIEYVLNKAGVKSSELDYITVTTGPGSFTGLRLGLSAAKAIEMAANVPVYGISSLEAYSEPFNKLSGKFIILSEIDARKDRFYAEAYCNGKKTFEAGDYTPEEILNLLNSSVKKSGINQVLICGPETNLLAEQINQLISEKKSDSADSHENIEFTLMDFNNLTTTSLFNLAEKMIENKTEPMNDYDGPVYLRASEAEVKLNK